MVAHFQYDAFGQILDGRENVTRYQFTGREHDSNTDYNYHRARWYDPASGKWLSEDPIGLAGGDVKLSRYVGNGPTNATDPSGLETQWHHLLGRRDSQLAQNFLDAGFTMDELDLPEYGWMLDSEYHLAKRAGNAGGCGLHPDWTKAWESYFKHLGRRPKKADILQQLEKMKTKYAHILKNGKQATLTYGEWHEWLGYLRDAAKLARKNPGQKIVVQRLPGNKLRRLGWLGKKLLGPGAATVTFVYAMNNQGFCVAAEQSVRDQMFPLVEAAEAVGNEAGAAYHGFVDAGILNERIESIRLHRISNDLSAGHPRLRGSSGAQR